MKRATKLTGWALLIVALAICTLYGALIASMLRTGPDMLLGCVDADPPVTAWTCKQVLRHASLTPDHIRELNRVAGAVYPVQMQDLQQAEEMLALFLERGVDINARNRQTKGWTALHIILGDPPERVALLLRHGARIDIRDEDGRTPLDLARLMLTKFPQDPNLLATIRILDAAR